MSGVLIVIDGPDGAGKGTQHKLLLSRLESTGTTVTAFDFPQYEKPSAWFVENYLAGKFGGLAEIGPREASLFYALDRYAYKNLIIKALSIDTVCVMNRYVVSNAGHQGGKISDYGARLNFFHWLDELEHEILGIPRPTINIILRLDDVQENQRRVDNRGARSYLAGRNRDIHEADLNHLRAAQATYAEIVKAFSTDKASAQTQYAMVSAEGSPEQVHDRIWDQLSDILAPFISGTTPGGLKHGW